MRRRNIKTPQKIMYHNGSGVRCAIINNLMTLSDQYELISTNGKYIGVRVFYNYTINLYLLDDVFYELWYFRPYNKIERIDVLEDEKTLDLYILSMNALDKKT
jgi:hypothetical protein